MNRRAQSRFAVLLLLPALLVYGVFVAVPAVAAFGYSLTRWDGLSRPVWIGLDNFRQILGRGEEFRAAFQHNLFLTVVPGGIILCLALYFAYLLHQRVRGASLYRAAFFFPNVISSVAISLLWTLIYSTGEVGLLNGALKAVFHLKEPIPFTESSRLLWALVPMIVWSATGFYIVLFLAAMEEIPAEIYEAARLDGVTPTTGFFRITLPLMWDVLTTGIVFLVIGGLKVFDSIWVMENGRPSADTHTLATLMYAKVFEEYDIGYGTAIAVCLFALVMAATVLSLRLLRRPE
jgi:ABC-type sugar transport system permease subunit